MSEVIQFADFSKVEIRVGQIVAAEIPDWSNKLLQFTVNFGEELGQRTIFSGVKKWYAPEDFLQKKFLFVVNLAPKKMGEAVSQGMMLMMDAEERPELIALPESAPVGAAVG